MRIHILAAGLLIAGLSACSTPRHEPGPTDLQRAEALRPQDAQLAERYERSCMTCHAARASGAPLTGYAPHWKERLAKGIDQLVKNANEGFNAMPAKGLCIDCTPEDLRALTVFMAGGAAT